MTLKLYIQPKSIVFAAQVNMAAAAYPADEIIFDGVTTGTYSIVNLNQTVLIGSSAGASDLGMTRIRKFATVDTLYIGRSSKGARPGEVTLTDDAYISVLDEIRIFPKIPYIDENGTTFFDSDLDWAGYGNNSPPVANAGPAVVGTIDSGTSLLTVNFSAVNSFVTAPGASIASYTWNVDGGTITVGTAASQNITATFAAGFYRVALLVADDNAESHYAYVNVLAIDPASDPSIEAFEILSHRITPQGQEIRLRIREDIDEATYLDGAWCVLWDGEPVDADDRLNVVFQGWVEIADEQIRGTATGLLRDVTLTCLDVAGRLKALPGFSTVIEHAASPATWQEMTTPDMGRFVHYLLQWQSTALDVADFTLAGDESDYTFKILASDGTNIFDQVDRRAGALIPDHLFTCNRRGQLAIAVDPMLQDTGDRTATVQATLTSDDYTDLTYRRQRNPRYHWLRSNAILAGTSAVATAFCIAPGTAPGFGAADMTDGEHLAISQDALNVTTGHRYARLNAAQGPFTIVLAEGNDLDLEPAALTWLQLTLDSGVAAQRGLTFTNARFLMQQIDIRYDHQPTGLVKTVTIRAERETTDGVPATTETVPAVVSIDDGGFAPGADVVGTAFFNNYLTGQERLAAIDASGYIYTTENFLSDPPTWSQNTAAATSYGFGLNSIMAWVVDPFSPLYRGTGTEVNGWVISTTAVSKVTDIFGTPAYSLSTSFPNQVNGFRGEYATINASFGRYQSVETDNPWIMCARAHNSGGADKDGVYIAYSMDGGQTWSNEIAVNGSTSDSSTWYSPLRIAGLWLSPRTPGLAYVGAYAISGNPATAQIYKTTDWGATWSLAAINDAPADGLGYCIHVPWHDNADESLVYYTSFTKNTNAHDYRLRRTNGTTDADISPTNASLPYGPLRGNFGIQSLDTNRLYMLMAGQGNQADALDIIKAGTSAVGGFFTSTDGGDTWTLRRGPVTGGPNGEWPTQGAFVSGDANKIYMWGNDGMLEWSTDNGATWTAKDPTGCTLEVIGIAGG